MKIKISNEWLKACGKQSLADQWLDAELIQSKSFSNFGNYYQVTLPDGNLWAVFSIRGVSVIE